MIDYHVCKYGVTLSRLTEETIELARQWRNDPEIAKYHEYREYITPEMQRIWFESINDGLNHYFIIEYQNQKIGVTNLKWNKTGNFYEIGTFIGVKEFQNSFVPVRSFLALHDFAFYDLELKELYSHIMKFNNRAIRYNEKFGYKLCENQEANENQLYKLLLEDYEQYSVRTRRRFGNGSV